VTDPGNKERGPKVSSPTGGGPRGDMLRRTLGAAGMALGSIKVLMSSGLHRTSAGDLSAKVFEKHAESIRSYLTISLRDVEMSRRAFLGCHDELERSRVADIKKAPSRVAHLYLLARNMADFSRLFDTDFEEHSIDAVPWDAAPLGALPDYGKALDQLRHTLSAEEFEMLELHWARELTNAGVAHVMGLQVEDCERKLQAAGAWAEMNARQIDAKAPGREELIRDACRILPPPVDEQGIASLSVPDPLPSGTIVADRYTIDREVGGGAFGWVYRASDVNVPGHIVALKMLHKPALTPAAREGAIRELSVIASAFHPSLVQFKDHGWFQDRLWFVMPWYDGETLQARIEREPLSLEEALEVFEPISRALDSIHRAGLRHQDVKPENIFLARVESGLGAGSLGLLPVLMDLGVAAPEGDMAVAGTPMYFAPEVASRFGDAESTSVVTDRSDVFALALALAHCVEPPDAAELANVDFESFVGDRSREVPEFSDSESLAPVADRLAGWLNFDAQKRPTAAELAREIAELRKSHGFTKEAKPRKRASKATLRRVTPYFLITALLAASAFYLGGLYREPAEPNGAEAEAVVVDGRADLLESERDNALLRAASLEEQLGELRSQVLFGDVEDRNQATEAASDAGAP